MPEPAFWARTTPSRKLVGSRFICTTSPIPAADAQIRRITRATIAVSRVRSGIRIRGYRRDGDRARFPKGPDSLRRYGDPQ
jgi:hypothetical protein